jgi:L-threonine kinase
MKYLGICPGSCGEFVQGMLDNNEYLVSYAIDKYSKAIIEERNNNIKLGPKKSRAAIEEVFRYFNLDVRHTRKLSLQIISEIPIGKGMASSNADIGATIKATLSLLNEEMTQEEISKLASKIEPTDSIYMHENCIFDPLKGAVKKVLGNISDVNILVLEPSETLNTKTIRSHKDYKSIKLKNKEFMNIAFKALETGFKNNDLKLIGEACTISSLANENIHKKEYLNEIIKISESYGAYGVNIAHSGTVIGIILDKDMDIYKLKQKIIDRNIHKKYNKIYPVELINGGLRGEYYGLYKESNDDRG